MSTPAIYSSICGSTHTQTIITIKSNKYIRRKKKLFEYWIQRYEYCYQKSHTLPTKITHSIRSTTWHHATSPCMYMLIVCSQFRQVLQTINQNVPKLQQSQSRIVAHNIVIANRYRFQTYQTSKHVTNVYIQWVSDENEYASMIKYEESEIWEKMSTVTYKKILKKIFSQAVDSQVLRSCTQHKYTHFLFTKHMTSDWMQNWGKIFFDKTTRNRFKW